VPQVVAVPGATDHRPSFLDTVSGTPPLTYRLGIEARHSAPPGWGSTRRQAAV